MFQADAILSIACRMRISLVKIAMVFPLLISGQTYMPIVLGFGEDFTAAYPQVIDSGPYSTQAMKRSVFLHQLVILEVFTAVWARDPCCGCCRGQNKKLRLHKLHLICVSLTCHVCSEKGFGTTLVSGESSDRLSEYVQLASVIKDLASDLEAGSRSPLYTHEPKATGIPFIVPR